MSGFRKSLTVKRAQPGAYVKGRWTQPSAVAGSIFASVQPTPARDLQTLPEGRRNAQSYNLFSDVALNSVSVNGQTNCDIVTVNLEDYEVYTCAPWQNSVINHYKMIVQRMTDTRILPTPPETLVISDGPVLE